MEKPQKRWKGNSPKDTQGIPPGLSLSGKAAFGPGAPTVQYIHKEEYSPPKNPVNKKALPANGRQPRKRHYTLLL
jgi:hypothetical protein